MSKTQSQRWRGLLVLFVSHLARLLRPLDGRLLVWAFCVPYMRVHPRPKDSKLLDGAEYFTSTFNKRSVGWWRIGNEKKRVLLMHGWAGNSTQLAPWVAGLRAQGFSIVAMDAPAHGESSGLRACMETTTGALLEFAKETGPYEGVVAHSFGGLTVSRALQEGLEANRIVIISSPTGPHYFFRKMMKILKIPEKRWVPIDDYLTRRMGYSLPELDVKNVWSELKNPVFVVHDQQDKEVNFSCHQDWLDAVPHAKDMITDGFGHRRILTTPKVIDAGISFLVGNAVSTVETATDNQVAHDAPA